MRSRGALHNLLKLIVLCRIMTTKQHGLELKEEELRLLEVHVEAAEHM